MFCSQQEALQDALRRKNMEKLYFYTLEECKNTQFKYGGCVNFILRKEENTRNARKENHHWIKHIESDDEELKYQTIKPTGKE